MSTGVSCIQVCGSYMGIPICRMQEWRMPLKVIPPLHFYSHTGFFFTSTAFYRVSVFKAFQILSNHLLISKFFAFPFSLCPPPPLSFVHRLFIHCTSHQPTPPLFFSFLSLFLLLIFLKTRLHACLHWTCCSVLGAKCQWEGVRDPQGCREQDSPSYPLLPVFYPLYSYQSSYRSFCLFILSDPVR